MKAKKYFIAALMLIVSACGSEDSIAPTVKEDVQTFCIMKQDWNGGRPKLVVHTCVELDGLWRFQNKKQYDIFESVNCDCD